MAQIGNVPEIIEVKNHLCGMEQEGLIKEWELPYEYLLTRLTAAIFFLTPTSEENMQRICQELKKYKDFRYRVNKERELSEMIYRVEFNQEVVN